MSNNENLNIVLETRHRKKKKKKKSLKSIRD
jgi:hypothetical protein